MTDRRRVDVECMPSSKRVDVTYSLDGQLRETLTGKKAFIMTVSDHGDIGLTAANVDSIDEMCELLEEALEQARRTRQDMRREAARSPSS